MLVCLSCYSLLSIKSFIDVVNAVDASLLLPLWFLAWIAIYFAFLRERCELTPILFIFFEYKSVRLFSIFFIFFLRSTAFLPRQQQFLSSLFILCPFLRPPLSLLHFSYKGSSPFLCIVSFSPFFSSSRSTEFTHPSRSPFLSLTTPSPSPSPLLYRTFRGRAPNLKAPLTPSLLPTLHHPFTPSSPSFPSSPTNKPINNIDNDFL